MTNSQFGDFFPIGKLLTQKANKLNIPLHGIFELTSRCNFNCKMCYIHEDCNTKKSELTLEQWIEIAKKAKEAGTLFLLLTGGEAMIRKDFIELYQKLAVMGFRIVINTNGSLFNDEIFQCFKQYPPARINISLYGSSETTYKQLCGIEAYHKVIKTIEALKKIKIPVRITMTLTPYNCKDCLDVYQISVDKQTAIEMSAYMFPPLRKDSDKIGKNDGRLSPQEAGHYNFLKNKIMMDREIFDSTVKQELTKITQYKQENKEVTCGNSVSCQAGRSSFWITWQGKMHPCGLMNHPEADVLKLGFDKAWNEIVKATSKIRLPKKCAICALRDLCRICPAMCLCETGKFDQVPEYICQMTETSYQEYQKYLENKELG